MIQGSTQSSIKAYIQVEDNGIALTGAGVVKYLFKFTNDTDGSVQYAYPATSSVTERYGYFQFDYNATPNVYLGRLNLELEGFYKYQVFEVTWITGGELTNVNMPPTEEFVFNPSGDTLGVVQGEVTKGKMYLESKRGTEEVTYSQNAKSVQTLTIEYGGAGYSTAPTISITTTESVISTATATCTISGGSVNSVTITNAGNGYTKNPFVVLSGGGASAQAVITANINETNYIYTS